MKIFKKSIFDVTFPVFPYLLGETTKLTVMPEQIYKFEHAAQQMTIRVSLLTGNIRYVYIGSRPLEDFRYVRIEAGMPISMADIEKAVNVL